MEFCGNYFLDYIIARHLYESTDYSPGEMNVRMRVTENTNPADIVMKNDLKIDEVIVLGKGTGLTDKIIADAFEAFIGALGCAEGLEKAREVILGMFRDEIKNFNPDGNYKGRLQEYVAKHAPGELNYIYSWEGPDHQKKWISELSLGDKKIAKGSGSTKREAATEAARKALSIVSGE
ncbi:MAG: hypothetical protein APR53_09250 [Methanoculleus sp. SDB]|nr:MAG: hypothetical protein APR53_09250 [Methanoculleus sp. SDB]